MSPLNGPSSGVESAHASVEISKLEALKEGAKHLDQHPGQEAMVALHELDPQKPISEQVEGWNTFRILLARVLRKIRDKGIDSFKAELQGQSLEEALQRHPALLNTLASQVDLSPEENIALYKFNQFKEVAGETAQKVREEGFWKELLTASKGGRWEQYQRLWDTQPEKAMFYTVGAVFLGALAWRKISRSETVKTWREKRKAAQESERGSDWFSPAGILTLSGLGMAVALAANWDKVVAAVGLEKLSKNWEKIKNKGEISPRVREEVEQKMAEAKEKAKKKAKELKQSAGKGEAATTLTEAVEGIQEDPYDLTTTLFVRFGFFENDMEGAWNMNFLERSILDMKEVTLQEMEEAVEVYEDDQGLPANYLKKIPSHSPFNLNLDAYQRWLLCKRIVAFSKLSELEPSQPLQEHFHAIAKDPLHDLSLKAHGETLEKIKKGEWKEVFNLDFEKIDKDFFREKGQALLEHAQNTLDPAVAERIHALSAEDQGVLRRIQFEMFRRTNMTEVGQVGQGVADALRHLELKSEEMNPEVIAIAEAFLQSTSRQTEALLPQIYARYQLPNNPNYVEKALTLQNLTFRHSVELLLASKEMQWDEHEENPKHWLKDFALLQIILKAMDNHSGQRTQFIVAMASVAAQASTRVKVPFLNALDPYLEGLGDYAVSEASDELKKALGGADAFARNTPFFQDSLDLGYDAFALMAATAGLKAEELSEIKSVRDFFTVMAQKEVEKGQGPEFFYDKEGSGWVILRILNKTFILKPIGTAKEVVDHLFEEGLIQGIPGGMEAVGSAVALPAFLGFLRAMWTYSGKEKGGKTWNFFFDRVVEGGKGAVRGSLWKFRLMRWTGNKMIVTGHGLYNFTTDRIESFRQIQGGVKEGVYLSEGSFSRAARRAHFAEKYTSQLKWEELSPTPAKPVPETWRTFLKRLRHEPGSKWSEVGKKVAQGMGDLAKHGVEVGVKTLGLGVDEALATQYLSEGLKDINQVCGLKEPLAHSLPEEWTAKTMGEIRDIQRQFASAMQKAAQDPALEKNLLDPVKNFSGEARKSALTEIFKGFGFTENQSLGLANQLVSEGDARLMAQDLKRAGELSKALEVKRSKSKVVRRAPRAGKIPSPPLEAGEFDKLAPEYAKRAQIQEARVKNGVYEYKVNERWIKMGETKAEMETIKAEYVAELKRQGLPIEQHRINVQLLKYQPLLNALLGVPTAAMIIHHLETADDKRKAVAETLVGLGAFFAGYKGASKALGAWTPTTIKGYVGKEVLQAMGGMAVAMGVHEPVMNLVEEFLPHFQAEQQVGVEFISFGEKAMARSAAGATLRSVEKGAVRQGIEALGMKSLGRVIDTKFAASTSQKITQFASKPVLKQIAKGLGARGVLMTGMVADDAVLGPVGLVTDVVAVGMAGWMAKDIVDLCVIAKKSHTISEFRKQHGSKPLAQVEPVSVVDEKALEAALATRGKTLEEMNDDELMEVIQEVPDIRVRLTREGVSGYEEYRFVKGQIWSTTLKTPEGKLIELSDKELNTNIALDPPKELKLFEVDYQQAPEALKANYRLAIFQIKSECGWTKLDHHVVNENEIQIKRLDGNQSLPLKRSGSTWSVGSFQSGLSLQQAVVLANLVNKIEGIFEKEGYRGGSAEPFHVDGDRIDFDKNWRGRDLKVLSAGSGWLGFYDQIGLDKKMVVQTLNNWYSGGSLLDSLKQFQQQFELSKKAA